MKIIAVFLLFLCLFPTVKAQTAQVTIYSEDPVQNIYCRKLTAGEIPSYASYEAGALDMDSAGYITLTMTLTQPFTLQCIVGERLFRIYLTPDSKERVNLLKDSIVYTGTNAHHNKALQIMDEMLVYVQNMQRSSSHELREVTEVHAFNELLESKRESTFGKLEKLKPDPAFLMEQKEHLQLAILNAWCTKLMKLFNLEEGISEEWKLSVSGLLNQPLPCRYACSYPEFENVAEGYIFCRALFIENIDPSTIRDTLNAFRFQEYCRNLEEPAREHTLAGLLYSNTSNELFSEDIPALYKFFFALYPDSQYADSLSPLQEKAIRFQQMEFDSIRFRILDSEPMYSHLTDLIRTKFAGRVVYADIWATWCGPCRRMFAHIPRLREATKELDIVHLYVSTDRDELQNKWIRMIPFYDMEGYHIRAQGELHESLFSDFGNERQLLAIPRYIIFGKDGQIAVSDAASPDQPDKVAKQLLESGAIPKAP